MDISLKQTVTKYTQMLYNVRKQDETFANFLKKEWNRLINGPRTERKTSNKLSRFSHKCDDGSIREMIFRENVKVSKLFPSNKNCFFPWYAVKIGIK